MRYSKKKSHAQQMRERRSDMNIILNFRKGLGPDYASSEGRRLSPEEIREVEAEYLRNRTIK